MHEEDRRDAEGECDGDPQDVAEVQGVHPVLLVSGCADLYTGDVRVLTRTWIGRSVDAMGEQAEQPKGRIRRWLDRRREGQRRAAEITQRRKAARKDDFERASRHGSVGSGDSGPFGE